MRTGPPRYEAIATAYDLGRVVAADEQPVRGLQGQVWRLTSTRGVWAVKETFGEITERAARRSGEFSEAARRAGVPAPPVRLTTDGRHVAAIDGVPFRVHGWVQIEAPDSLLDPAQVGTALARLHRTVRRADSAPHWWYTEPVGAATWDELIDQCLAAGAPFAGRLAGIRDDLVALEMIMTPMEPVQLCHLDLWADNVRRSGEGLCIIDWDNCGGADPSRELALVVFEFARTDPRRIVELVAAYREHGGPGLLRTTGDFAMLAAQLGHIGAMHLRRWLDPSISPTERARALEGIEEFVGDPFTPAGAVDILDALE